MEVLLQERYGETAVMDFGKKLVTLLTCSGSPATGSREPVTDNNKHGILFGRCESPVGRNVLFCMRRFNAVLSDILSEEFDTFVWKHVTKDISDEQEQSASLLKECILSRDSFLSLPEIFALTDIENIISEVCSMR